MHVVDSEAPAFGPCATGGVSRPAVAALLGQAGAAAWCCGICTCTLLCCSLLSSWSRASPCARHTLHAWLHMLLLLLLMAHVVEHDPTVPRGYAQPGGCEQTRRGCSAWNKQALVNTLGFAGPAIRGALPRPALCSPARRRCHSCLDAHLPPSSGRWRLVVRGPVIQWALRTWWWGTPVMGALGAACLQDALLELSR
jgi:hypothetical protein